MDEEKTPIAGRSQSTSAQNNVLFYDKNQGPFARRCEIIFVVLVALMVLITICLSIYRGVDLEEYGGYYFLLGAVPVGWAIVEIILIIFIRKGYLPKEKAWFLYFVGGIVMLEAIFTNALLFH